MSEWSKRTVLRLERLTGLLGLSASIAIFGVALWFLHRELAQLSLTDVASYARAVPPLDLLVAVCAAAGSYFMLTFYDGLALKYLGLSVPYRVYALTAFMAYAIGHNLGFATISGGSLRYRMYTLRGLSGTEIARIIVFVTATFGLGAAALLGASLSIMPTAETARLSVDPTIVAAAATALLLIPIGYLGLSLVRKTPLVVRGWQFVLPRPRVAGAQVVVSIADLALAALSLYALLSPIVDVGFLQFLGIFLVAMFGGLVSSVPAGLGVFEAVLIAMLPDASTGALLGAVIVYRLVYYVVPLGIALSILVVNEVRTHRSAIIRSSERVGNHLSSVTPHIASVIVFFAGVVLLVSGASPAAEGRLRLIVQVLPLPILEFSHLAGSTVGVFLLVLARGLYQRLRMAHLAALGALALGIVFSLLKGLDYEEALILGAVGGVLWACRDEFYRTGTATAAPFSRRWLVAIVLVAGGVIWVILVSFRDVDYARELWWQFAFDADAPRALRAGVVAGVTLLALGVWSLLWAPTRLDAPRASMDTAKVRRVLLDAQDSSANVALLGDKELLWSADERAFIMYQTSGNSWIALGDPVGPVSRHEELVWAFRGLVDRHNGRPVFYQVSDQSLPLYIDLGLSLSKLGEDGRVDLAEFSLEGHRRADLRQAMNRAKRLGASFEVIPRDRMSTVLHDLRRISDEWLHDKATGEKSFSLGSFSETYVENFDCAVVHLNGAIVAFANLWTAPAAGEFSIDLMRHAKEAPSGVMDYLFTELMLWGSTAGYRWFSLGMAPLSGMEERALAPLWHKVGHLIFTHGESFYNFEGLRSYKEKFDPQWRPRYLACPGGWLDLPLALVDAARLISGGVARAFVK